MIHLSVLPDKSIEMLNPRMGDVFVDGTLGAGGHTERIARAVGPNGLVIAFDRDVTAIDRTERRLKQAGLRNIRYVHANYRFLGEALDRLGIAAVDGILLDIGLSSDQLADRERGFSFESEGLLDLRFDTSEGQPAYELLEHWSEEHIADVLFQYGEEKFSRRIARAIVEKRTTEKPLRTAREFAEIVRRRVPREKRDKRDKFGNHNSRNIDPATRSFQGLRIAVNEELDSLDSLLKSSPDHVKPGGRVAVISFHSLEDRVVKNYFRDEDRLNVLTKKPIIADEEECNRNPRARSAKLRVAERVGRGAPDFGI